MNLKYFILFMLIPFFGISQSSTYKDDSLKLVSSAFATLKTEMSKHDFKKLNMRQVVVDTLPDLFYSQLKLSKEDIKPILTIYSKKDSNKIMLYTEQNGVKYFNWVYLNLIIDSGYYTGNVQTFSIHNKPLKKWTIKRDKTIMPGKNDSVNFGNKKISGPLPNVVFTIKLTNSNKKSSSLPAFSAYYLLFNENLADDNPLSSIYFFLNYNALYYDVFLGHMSSHTVEGKLN